MACTSQIELSLSCVNLLNLDTFSKSDPYCVVLTRTQWQDRFFEFARTEVIDDCLSPSWVKKFIFDYNFETIQRLRFEVWDKDIGESDFLGAHETTLAEIISYSSSNQYIRQLEGKKGKDGKNRGQLIVVAEELSACKQSVVLKFAAQNLPRSFFGWVSPQPFLVISRSNESTSTLSVVAKSKHNNSTSDPVWVPLNMSVRSLCNGDHDRNLKIEIFNWSNSGSHKLLGSCFTSLRELLTGATDQTAVGVTQSSTGQNIVLKSSTPKNFPLIMSKPKHNRSNKPRALILREITLMEEFTFLDYIKSGTQLHFALAIDFTASNGPSHDANSLHYINHYNGNPNSYEMALRAVGSIIAQYDTSGMYPAFGFGAKLPPSGEVSHQFPLNGNIAQPYCSNIDEIITHYRRCASTVTLFGPTNFAPVINNTAQIASKFEDGKHYFVLLIITDGIISDMYQTMKAIVNASKRPLSIIIIGVGHADFTAMDELDSDDHLLRIDGEKAQRDIVQFVPLNKFLTGNVPGIESQADLAREVLAEIPDQVTGYMKTKGFWPKLNHY